MKRWLPFVMFFIIGGVIAGAIYDKFTPEDAPYWRDVVGYAIGWLLVWALGACARRIQNRDWLLR